jgi:hypothetical protein
MLSQNIFQFALQTWALKVTKRVTILLTLLPIILGLNSASIAKYLSIPALNEQITLSTLMSSFGVTGNHPNFSKVVGFLEIKPQKSLFIYLHICMHFTLDYL